MLAAFCRFLGAIFLTVYAFKAVHSESLRPNPSVSLQDFQLTNDPYHPSIFVYDHSDFRGYFHKDMAASGPIFIFFGGAQVQVERYNILARRLIADYPGSAFVIPKFAGLMANPIQAKGKVRVILEALKALGRKDPAGKSFLMAHSQGGVMAHSLVEPLNLRGLILLGSYLPRTKMMASRYDVSNFPRPILTLGAELDGLTGVHFMAREYKDSIAWQNQNPDSYRHEVWVLPDLNHMHFADGGYLASDIPSDVRLEEGHVAIISAITTFTRLNMPDAYMSSRFDMKVLADQFRRKTKEILEPIFAAQQLDHTVCEQSQRRIALSLGERLDMDAISIDAHRVDNFFSFVLDKASIIDNGRVYIPYYVESPPNLTDVSLFEQLAPATVACKMRNTESLYAHFSISSEPAHGEDFLATENSITCVELNKALMNDTINLLNDSQKVRLEARVSLDDAISFELAELPSGIQWLSGFFKFAKQEDNKWVLRTQQLRTALDTKPAAFAGAHYCKLIAPSRFMNWLLMESMSY